MLRLNQQTVGFVATLRENSIPTNYIVIHQGAPNGNYFGFGGRTVLMRENLIGPGVAVPSGSNDYQAGDAHAFCNGPFIQRFASEIQNQIGQVRVPFRPGNGTSPTVSNGIQGLITLAFIPSHDEVGFNPLTDSAPIGGVGITEVMGSRFDYFIAGTSTTANNRRIATYGDGNGARWSTRTPSWNTAGARMLRRVTELGRSEPGGGAEGYRPIIALPGTLLVSDSGEILVTQPPTTPPSINVPVTVPSGGSVNITWTASTDPQGQAIIYILERQINSSGTWTQIWQGSALNANDTSIPSSATTVQWRVTARNLSGLLSAPRLSPARTIIANNPPTINGSDGDLGERDGPFSMGYVVSDPDPGDVLTITERLNGAVLRTFIGTTDTWETATVDFNNFIQLGNAAHTLSVTVSDQLGASAVRTWTFSRNESQIDVRLNPPLQASAMPVRMVLGVDMQIPNGATFAVFACNNGNDETPFWEDVSWAVMSGSVFNFSNTSNFFGWAVNILVHVDRNGATGPCFVQGAGGNFDGGVGMAGAAFKLEIDAENPGTFTVAQLEAIEPISTDIQALTATDTQTIEGVSE